MTLKELGSSTTEIGVSVHRTTLTVHSKGLGFMEEWPKKEENKAAHLDFTRRHIGDFQNPWKTVLWSDVIKM